jgi:hypothetical protein
MKYIFSILLFTLCSYLGFTQTRFYKIDSILDSKDSIDMEKIGIYRSAFQSYNVISQGYIFWQKENSNFIQKIQYSEYPNEQLYVYELLEIPTNIIMLYFNKEKSKLLNEGFVKPFEHEESGWKDGILSTGKPFIAHGKYSQIRIFYNDSIFDKKINHFDLSENLSNEQQTTNIHYEYNNRLKVVEFDRVLQEYIFKLQEQNLFQLDGE